MVTYSISLNRPTRSMSGFAVDPMITPLSAMEMKRRLHYRWFHNEGDAVHCRLWEETKMPLLQQLSGQQAEWISLTRHRERYESITEFVTKISFCERSEDRDVFIQAKITQHQRVQSTVDGGWFSTVADPGIPLNFTNPSYLNTSL